MPAPQARRVAAFLVLSLAASAAVVRAQKSKAAIEPDRRYAVVTRASTAAEPGWDRVIARLREAHGARVFTFEQAPGEVREAVGAFAPRYVCFVVQPSEDFPRLVPAANAFCRRLDGDPYVDAIWGVLTGLDADHALELAAAPPIVIRRAFLKDRPEWLRFFRRGRFLTPSTEARGETAVKEPGRPPESATDGPKTDRADAQLVARLLGSEPFDLILGAGHGRHHDWMLTRPGGRAFLRASEGRLTLHGAGAKGVVASSHPKVYWAPGGGETGLIGDRTHDYRQSYALAWMSQGVRQYVGSTAETSDGTPWLMADWLLSQQGRWTVAESLFLLRQWTRHRIWKEQPFGRALEGAEQGDRISVLYGDPAVEARLAAELKPSLDERLEVKPLKKGGLRIRYRVRVNDLAAGTAEHGWRLHATLLPFAVTDVSRKSSDFLDVTIADETIIWDAGQPLRPGDERYLTFTARRPNR